MASIIDLPLELLRSVAEELDLFDLCRWAESHAFIAASILGNGSFCQELVQNLIPNSHEGFLASKGEISYQKALITTYQRRSAYVSCKPHCITVVPAASDFVYSEGTLCYIVSNLVHVDRVLAALPPVAIDLDHALGFARSSADGHFRLVHFSSNILTVRVRSSKGRKLAVFKVNQARRLKCRPSLMITVPLNRIEVIRNDDHHVVVGTFRDALDGIGAVWHFAVFSLHGREQRRLQNVGNFGTSEIGATVVVEILDGYLWIISSQITHDHEGPDPTSYYGGCYISLAEVELGSNTKTENNTLGSSSNAVPAEAQPTFFRMWRRQQKEGPIHDSWTNLSLTKSESSAPTCLLENPVEELAPSTDTDDELPSPTDSQSPLVSTSHFPLPPPATTYVLTETRSEWTSPASPSRRTHYATHFAPFSPQSIAAAPIPNKRDIHLPPLARLAKAAGQEDTDEYVEHMLAECWSTKILELKGVRRKVQVGRASTGSLSESDPEPFKLPSVFHRSFEPGTQAGIDLVRDNTTYPPQLRLRATGAKNAMFPPQEWSVSQMSYDIFDAPPPPPATEIKAFSDARAVVWGVKPKRGETTQVNIVGFDRRAKWGKGDHQKVLEKALWDQTQDQLASATYWDTPPAEHEGTEIDRSLKDQQSTPAKGETDRGKQRADLEDKEGEQALDTDMFDAAWEEFEQGNQYELEKGNNGDIAQDDVGNVGQSYTSYDGAFDLYDDPPEGPSKRDKDSDSDSEGEAFMYNLVPMAGPL